MTMPLDALLYTVPLLVPLLAEVTLKDFALFCIITAMLGFALSEGWRYWKK